MKTIELWLVRHGQTDWNLARRFQGQSDIPLNATGIKQAQELAKHLAQVDFDAVYSSDLQRAALTARILAERQGAGVHYDRRLREICHGKWEGLTMDEVRSRFPDTEQAQQEDCLNAHAPGGESILQVSQRMASLAHDLAQKPAGGRYLVVTHGLSAATLFCQARSIELQEVYRHIPDNASPLVVNWPPGRCELE